MAELGSLLGSLMSELVKARRIADEQTAALAEYYSENPLLEGLSVPRVRIPELTIDMPLLIEDQLKGDPGELEETSKIVEAVGSQLDKTLAENSIEIEPELRTSLLKEVEYRVEAVKKSNTPVIKEAIVRGVQDAVTSSFRNTRRTISPSAKEMLSSDIRARISEMCVAREPVAAAINANIKTADVKENATASSVVRLKITLKEEGLEWATQADNAGGVVRTLQVE